MSKKLTFSKKPQSNSAPANEADSSALDAFVGVQPKQQPAASTEKMKRFTFDVPPALHRRVKTHCAAKGVDMADEMRRLLEENFPEQS